MRGKVNKISESHCMAISNMHLVIIYETVLFMFKTSNKKKFNEAAVP